MMTPIWLTIALALINASMTLAAPVVALYVERRWLYKQPTHTPDTNHPASRDAKKAGLLIRVLSPSIMCPICIAYDCWWLSSLLRFAKPSNLTIFDISFAVGNIVFCVVILLLSQIDEKVSLVIDLIGRLVWVNKKMTENSIASENIGLEQSSLLGHMMDHQGRIIQVLEHIHGNNRLRSNAKIKSRQKGWSQTKLGHYWKSDLNHLVRIL